MSAIKSGSNILKLLANNRKYVNNMTAQDPKFFHNLADIQTPDYLWIGCADSRVPANEIIGLKPGEVFVHRNIANVVGHSDFNALSAIHFSIDYLKVKHVIVCGHYNCGGVKASMSQNQNMGLFQNWTKHITDVYNFYEPELKGLPENELLDRMCELNVMWQLRSLCLTTVVQDNWQRGVPLNVYGLIYDIRDGILKDTGIYLNSLESYNSFNADFWKKRVLPKVKQLNNNSTSDPLSMKTDEKFNALKKNYSTQKEHVHDEYCGHLPPKTKQEHVHDENCGHLPPKNKK